MEMSTLIGLLSGLGFIVIGILWGGGALESFIDSSSVMITLGGTLASIAVGYPLKELKNLPKVLGIVFQSDKRTDIMAQTRATIELANLARKDGLLALEERAESFEDPFMRKGFRLIVDGTDPELVKSIMEAEIASVAGRHQKGVNLMESMGALAPAFGMIGTLIGLITMLRNLDDPGRLGPGMATALITTFYGSMLANLVFIPIAGKLKGRTEQEVFAMELGLEGMLSIQAGENPRLIEEKLYSFLPRDAGGRQWPGGNEEGYGI